jgi:hypothetical protein
LKCIKGFASNNHALRKSGYITQGCKEAGSEGSNFLHRQGRKETWALGGTLTIDWNPNKTHWWPLGTDTYFT